MLRNLQRVLADDRRRDAVASRMRTVGLLCGAVGCALPRDLTSAGTWNRHVEVFLNVSFAVVAVGLLFRLFAPRSRWAVEVCWLATGLWVARGVWFNTGLQHFATWKGDVASSLISYGFAVLSLVVWWVEGEPYLPKDQRR